MTRTRRFIRGIQEILGLPQIDDQFIEEVRREVYARCEKVPVYKYKRKAAQQKMAVEALEAIVDVFRRYFPERNIQIGRSWPGAFCTISMDEAIVEIDIGIDYDDQGDGVEPIRIPVDRGKRGPDISERIQAALKPSSLIRKSPVQVTAKTTASKPQVKPAKQTRQTAPATAGIRRSSAKATVKKPEPKRPVR